MCSLGDLVYVNWLIWLINRLCDICSCWQLRSMFSTIYCCCDQFRQHMIAEEPSQSGKKFFPGTNISYTLHMQANWCVDNEVTPLSTNNCLFTLDVPVHNKYGYISAAVCHYHAHTPGRMWSS